IARRILETVQSSDFTILLEGHTADVGKPVGQMNLSIERTQTIKNELINRGIPENLFTIRGFGGTQPIAPNSTEEGRRQNRRVKIIIQPKAEYIQRD
ncbi:MAG: OmpA family protein, partial [Treponema sp.]|nr:OmpA family protein [Treponema sp.]